MIHIQRWQGHGLDAQPQKIGTRPPRVSRWSFLWFFLRKTALHANIASICISKCVNDFECHISGETISSTAQDAIHLQVASVQLSALCAKMITKCREWYTNRGDKGMDMMRKPKRLAHGHLGVSWWSFLDLFLALRNNCTPVTGSYSLHRRYTKNVQIQRQLALQFHSQIGIYEDEISLLPFRKFPRAVKAIKSKFHLLTYIPCTSTGCALNFALVCPISGHAFRGELLISIHFLPVLSWQILNQVRQRPCKSNCSSITWSSNSLSLQRINESPFLQNTQIRNKNLQNLVVTRANWCLK